VKSPSTGRPAGAWSANALTAVAARSSDFDADARPESGAAVAERGLDVRDHLAQVEPRTRTLLGYLDERDDADAAALLGRVGQKVAALVPHEPFSTTEEAGRDLTNRGYALGADTGLLLARRVLRDHPGVHWEIKANPRQLTKPQHGTLVRLRVAWRRLTLRLRVLPARASSSSARTGCFRPSHTRRSARGAERRASPRRTPQKNTSISLFGGIGSASSFYDVPRLAFDYVATDGLTIGGAVFAWFTLSATASSGGGPSRDTSKLTLLGVAPRIGYLLPLSSSVWFWPRAGVTYVVLTSSPPTGSSSSLSQFAANAEAMFVFSPVEHVGITLGPAVDVPITGSFSGGGPSDVSQFRVGVTVGLDVWF
jgi:hypothetical protein